MHVQMRCQAIRWEGLEYDWRKSPIILYFVIYQFLVATTVCLAVLQVLRTLIGFLWLSNCDLFKTKYLKRKIYHLVIQTNMRISFSFFSLTINVTIDKGKKSIYKYISCMFLFVILFKNNSVKHCGNLSLQHLLYFHAKQLFCSLHVRKYLTYITPKSRKMT